MYNLKLEVFESDKSIEPIHFYIYKVTPKEQVSSIQQFMRSVAGKISYRSPVRAFTDDKKVYTLEKIANLDIDDSFEITYEKDEYIISIKDDSYISNLFKEIAKFDNITKFSVEEPSLNEIFISKVGESYEK